MLSTIWTTVKHFILPYKRCANSVCNAQNLTTFSYRIKPVSSICLFLIIICFSTSVSLSLSPSSPLSLLSRFQFWNPFDLIWYCFFYYYYIWIRNTETVLHNQIHNAHFRMIAFLVYELQKSRFNHSKANIFEQKKEQKSKMKWQNLLPSNRFNIHFILRTIEDTTCLKYYIRCDAMRFYILYIHTRVD